jgi:LytR cell envelope-related transcriptional attenuator
MDRAAILLGLFVLVTVLLLGRIHPAVPTSAASAATSTTTTTTAPGSPASTSTVPSTTTTTTPKAKSNVPVQVVNASGEAGAAASITNQLQAAGWNVQAPMNATATVSTSSVYYVAGQKAAAEAVAATLHLPASSVLPYTTAAPVSTIGTAEVLVVVAPDLATPASSTTTTTTHAGT